MRRVNLAGTNLECSALGFGCANLMGRLDRRESLRALGHAFDAGVTLFDTARSYGWGRSEEVVGEFVKARRTQVTVVTKLGILPPERSRLREIARPLVRHVLRAARRLRAPQLEAAMRGGVKTYASTAVKRSQFDVTAARLSLETSLRALALDAIDILLLHSPQPEDLADGELVEFLRSQVQRGVIRSFGLASSSSTCQDIAAQHDGMNILEYPLNILLESPGDLGRPVASLTHSPFGGSQLRLRLQRLLAARPDRARDWGSRLGFQLEGKGLSRFLLRAAIHANPRGAVLCGMHGEDHIRENARVAAASLSLDPAVPHVAREARQCLLEFENEERARAHA